MYRQSFALTSPVLKAFPQAMLKQAPWKPLPCHRRTEAYPVPPDALADFLGGKLMCATVNCFPKLDKAG